MVEDLKAAAVLFSLSLLFPSSCESGQAAGSENLAQIAEGQKQRELIILYLYN